MSNPTAILVVDDNHDGHFDHERLHSLHGAFRRRGEVLKNKPISASNDEIWKLDSWLSQLSSKLLGSKVGENA